MEISLITFFLMLLGLCIGSFLSVVIFRIKNEEKGIIAGRSHCSHCKKTLGASDLIPVVSFVLHRGKCRFCKKKISAIYPLLELTSGLILPFNFLYTVLTSGNVSIYNVPVTSVIQFIFYSIACFILIAIAFYDLISKEIPNLFLYTWIAFSVITALVLKENSWQSIVIALLIALFFFGSQILISKGKWLGSGDVFFAVGMAILLGFERIIIGIVLSYVLGSIICIILLSTKKLERKDSVAFTPFLALGTFLSLYFGKAIFLWYMSNGLINLPL